MQVVVSKRSDPVSGSEIKDFSETACDHVKRSGWDRIYNTANLEPVYNTVLHSHSQLILLKSKFFSLPVAWPPLPPPAPWCCPPWRWARSRPRSREAQPATGCRPPRPIWENCLICNPKVWCPILVHKKRIPKRTYKIKNPYSALF